MYGQFFILFAMIVVGYYGYRKGWLTREVNKGLGGLVMHCLLYTSNEIYPSEIVMISNRKPRRQNGLRGFFDGKYGKKYLFWHVRKFRRISM